MVQIFYVWCVNSIVKIILPEGKWLEQFFQMKIENSSPDSQPLPPFCGPQIVHFEVFFLGKILLSEEKSIVQVLFFCIIYLLRSVHVTLSGLW